ncbi:bacterial transcriptional activator domain-containing protein [Desulfobacterium sp. N47]|uniref:bacterial transcriptional activator domain-containing protein n=1 Tax=Desulfobacterium sp. N47 TaxID=3115210 RepID=UPI003F4A3B8E
MVKVNQRRLTFLDLPIAAACYERCLEVDELFEGIYRQLMICYKNLGKKGSALSVYQRCKKRLSFGLGIAPSLETKAVLASLYSKAK